MRLYSFILAVILLSSCNHPHVDLNDSSTWGNVTDYYYKCFFLGETNILIEGEVLQKSQEPRPFDTLVAKIRYKPKSDTSNNYLERKFPATKVSESKFQLPVDITTIDTTLDNYYEGQSNYIFRSGGPAFELEFYLDNRSLSINPAFQEPVNNNEYRHFLYRYMYVAEAVDRSHTDKDKVRDGFGFDTGDVIIHHYDLNFSKPGWYKIIQFYYREIGDDPKFSTGENTYFFPS